MRHGDGKARGRERQNKITTISYTCCAPTICACGREVSCLMVTDLASSRLRALRSASSFYRNTHGVYV